MSVNFKNTKINLQCYYSFEKLKYLLFYITLQNSNEKYKWQ